MASNLRWDARSAMALTRSARSVQHTHPFCSSTSPGSSRSSARVLRTRALSMLSAATSLTTTATRKLPAFSTMRLSSVVLPAPRNPERRVTGIGVCMVMSWLEVVACAEGLGNLPNAVSIEPTEESAEERVVS